MKLFLRSGRIRSVMLKHNLQELCPIKRKKGGGSAKESVTSQKYHLG